MPMGRSTLNILLLFALAKLRYEFVTMIIQARAIRGKQLSKNSQNLDLVQ